MKESYGEGLATHTGPKSCVTAREGEGEALTGVRAGPVLSREIHAPPRGGLLRGADAVRVSGRPHPRRRQGEAPRDPARSQTWCMYGNTLRGNREVPRPPAADGVAAGRVGKPKGARR
jgi:RNA-directed DNA polymerase